MSFFKNMFASGESDRAQPTSFSFNTPGFNFSTQQNGSDISTSFGRKGTFAQTAADQRTPRMLGDIDALRGTLVPGFSDLRNARMGELDAARTRTVSNLQNSLSNRRVAGSSFAQNALTNAETSFAREKANSQAASFLEELAANQQVLNQEFAVISGALEREFQEAGMAASIGTQMAQLLQQGAQFEQQQAFQKQQMGAQLFSTLVGAATSGFAAGGAFNPTQTINIQRPSTVPTATR